LHNDRRQVSLTVIYFLHLIDLPMLPIFPPVFGLHYFFLAPLLSSFLVFFLKLAIGFLSFSSRLSTAKIFTHRPLLLYFFFPPSKPPAGLVSDQSTLLEP
jgi:hypothetical protein